MKEKINQTAGRLKQTVRAAGAGIATLAASFFMSAPAYAAGVQDSQIVKGTEQLIGDVTTWLMVLAPVVAGLLIIYFCIRRGMADEMDQKKWNNRIVVAVVSCIGAVLGSATLNLILGYYQYDIARCGDSINLSFPESKTRRGRVGKDLATTLETSCNQGTAFAGCGLIRRLTPRECWRLQGFTDEMFDKARAVNSDNQLYRQAGNSVTVPVIYAIGKQILAAQKALECGE